MAANKGALLDELLNSLDTLGSIEEQESLLRSFNEKTQAKIHKIVLKKRIDEWSLKDAHLTDELNRLYNLVTVSKSKACTIDMGNFFPEIMKSEFCLTIPQTNEKIKFKFEATGPYDRSSGTAFSITYQSNDERETLLDNGGWFDDEYSSDSRKLNLKFLSELRQKLQLKFTDREMLKFLLLAGSARGDERARIVYETKDSDLDSIFDSIDYHKLFDTPEAPKKKKKTYL